MPDRIARLNAALESRYRIERKIGEGGMATVYLADDLRHERKVAVKVLKPELAAVIGAERFLAEIKTTANLQHPHVLPLFDSGEADGFLFYVMPYVEGVTLGDRIEREKQLPVDEAVRITTAIANALQHAHDRGVIHRDIKPGNILLQDGQPVVSDFGVALAVGSAGGTRLTETGLSVGTPYYMSPEQATGDQLVGPPSDTYALAAVLYEMLTGDPPYVGSTAQAVLGKIIQGTPVSASELRRAVPANVDAAIRKGLEKLPADRFSSAQDFARALGDPSFRHGVPAGPIAHARRRRVSEAVGWGAAAALAALLAWTSGRPEPARRVGRFAIATEDGTAFTRFANILPDGSGMVYVAPGASGANMLWVRRWNETSGTPVRGTEGADETRISVSPDGREVLFAAGFPGALRVAPLLGGSVREIADAAYGGGVWSADGETIYFCDGEVGISRVSANGGDVTQLLDTVGVNYVPLALLEGRDVLLFRAYEGARYDASYVEALALGSRAVTTLVEGSSPAAVTPAGHLVFGTTDGAMMAAPFDAEALAVTAVPTLMVDGIATNSQLHAMATVAGDGSLLYLPGSAAELTPAWVNRDGSVRIVDPEWHFPGSRTYSSLALSPDGTRLALTLLDVGWHIWIKELDDGPLSKLTFEGGSNRRPSWSRDGNTVFFLSNRGRQGVWSRPADGSRAAKLVFDRAEALREVSVAPGDGSLVLRSGAYNNGDIFAVTPSGNGTPTVLVNSDLGDRLPTVSPDGRWLAYASNESGRYEVYVRPFPDAQSTRQQVSADGGDEPVWSPDGRELFYRGPTHYMAASVATEPTFSVRERRALFPVDRFLGTDGGRMYDVDPKSDRFIMFLEGTSVPTALVLVQNWFEEVEAQVGG